jgi:hypothetical protein
VNFDALRFFAATAVVWRHAVSSEALRPYAWIGWAGVSPFFLSISFVLLVGSLRCNPNRPLYTHIARRAHRLLIPFVVWDLIYLLARLGKQLALGQSVSVASMTDGVVSGVASQLWFLPALFLLSIPAFVTARYAIRNGRIPEVCAGLLFAGAALAVTPPPDPTAFGPAAYLADRIWTVLPAACWSLALGLAMPMVCPILDRCRYSGPIVLSIALVTVALMPGGYSVGLYSGMGVVWAMLAITRWENPVFDAVHRLGHLGFGVFLSHNLFVEGAQTGMALLGLPRSAGTDLVVFVIALVGSFWLAARMAQTRIGRFLMPSR